MRRSGEGEKGRCLPWSKEEEGGIHFLNETSACAEKWPFVTSMMCLIFLEIYPKKYSSYSVALPNMLLSLYGLPIGFPSYNLSTPHMAPLSGKVVVSSVLWVVLANITSTLLKTDINLSQVWLVNPIAYSKFSISMRTTRNTYHFQ